MSPDIHTLTGAYAADALSEPERRDFERHLAECGDCAREVSELQATAARMGAATSTPPPAHLKAQVMARIATTRQDPPVAARRAETPSTAPAASGSPRVSTGTPSSAALPADDELSARRARRFGGRLAMAGIAASLVAAATLGVTAVQLRGDLEQSRSALAQTRSQLGAQQAQQASLTEVLAAPDAHTASGPVSGGGHGTAVVSPSIGKAVFVATDLPVVTRDRTYQLWLIGTDGPRSAGVFNAATKPMILDNLGSADKLGVTIEPAGGSKAPTTVPVLLFSLST